MLSVDEFTLVPLQLTWKLTIVSTLTVVAKANMDRI